ncbi:tetratricopeptide repeat protein [Lignipirellula cremea]|uniref:Tetratricopeptide repeat protein n=1 Tax=Lignipirellula cremea TaxID=2528010 RepID=A0A518E4S2_9BACT|nr:tetratricopeptide repeat protein [Lignipirellula cremea]QDU99086.1 tetratricopeptide repeat protein [Lignipirellula cremea]
MAVPQLQSAFDEQEVVATGRFASMTHGQLRKLILAHGGCWAPQVTLRTRWLMVGQDGPPLDRAGRWTKNLERAAALRDAGQPLEILTEQRLLDRLGVAADSPAQRQYSIVELCQLLGISGRMLRSWSAAGLIDPIDDPHGVPYFDFSQVAAARKLCQLMASGVSLAGVKRALTQVRQWLPDDQSLLSCLATCTSERTLLLRGADGRLAEPGGQLMFDFEEPTAPTVAIPPSAQTVEDLFEEAFDHEQAGRWMAAARLYRQAIACEPDDPVLHFNLGNVYAAQQQTEAAIDCYQSAVEQDPAYAEAWNNLGNACARQQRPVAAIAALQQAIACSHGYPAAHFNLAETYAEQGRIDLARRHWRQCLEETTDEHLSQSALERLKTSLRMALPE